MDLISDVKEIGITCKKLLQVGHESLSDEYKRSMYQNIFYYTWNICIDIAVIVFGKMPGASIAGTILKTIRTPAIFTYYAIKNIFSQENEFKKYGEYNNSGKILKTYDSVNYEQITNDLFMNIKSEDRYKCLKLLIQKLKNNRALNLSSEYVHQFLKNISGIDKSIIITEKNFILTKASLISLLPFWIYDIISTLINSTFSKFDLLLQLAIRNAVMLGDLDFYFSFLDLFLKYLFGKLTEENFLDRTVKYNIDKLYFHKNEPTDIILKKTLTYFLIYANSAYFDDYTGVSTILKKNSNNIWDGKIIRYFQHSGQLFHYLSYDNNIDAYVICIKGTSYFSDILKDVLALTILAKIGNENVYFHEGMYVEAVKIYNFYSKKTVFGEISLSDIIKQNKRIYCVGHSLGGGVATILSILIRNGSVNVPKYDKCYTISYATPCVVDDKYAEKIVKYTASIVNDNDIITRVTCDNICNFCNKIKIDLYYLTSSHNYNSHCNKLIKMYEAECTNNLNNEVCDKLIENLEATFKNYNDMYNSILKNTDNANELSKLLLHPDIKSEQIINMSVDKIRELLKDNTITDSQIENERKLALKIHKAIKKLIDLDIHTCRYIKDINTCIDTKKNIGKTLWKRNVPKLYPEHFNNVLKSYNSPAYKVMDELSNKKLSDIEITNRGVYIIIIEWIINSFNYNNDIYQYLNIITEILSYQLKKIKKYTNNAYYQESEILNLIHETHNIYNNEAVLEKHYLDTLKIFLNSIEIDDQLLKILSADINIAVCSVEYIIFTKDCELLYQYFYMYAYIKNADTNYEYVTDIFNKADSHETYFVDYFFSYGHDAKTICMALLDQLAENINTANNLIYKQNKINLNENITLVPANSVLYIGKIKDNYTTKSLLSNYAIKNIKYNLLNNIPITLDTFNNHKCSSYMKNILSTLSSVDTGDKIDPDVLFN